MFLITGVGRSGTLYITHVLRAAGLDVGHETHLGKDGIVSWEWALSEAPFYPSWHAQVQPKFDIVLHQIRDPLKTISSCLKSVSEEAWKYIFATTPISSSCSNLARCAEYWYYFSHYAQTRASWKYRVENLEKVRSEFAKRLGIAEIPLEALRKIPKNVHGSSHDLVTWENIKKETSLYPEIRRLAKLYGY